MPYSTSKASSEHLERPWHNTYGRPVVHTNCSNNYVPWQLREKLIPLYADGDNVSSRQGDSYCIGDAANHDTPRERANKQITGAICGLVNQLRPVTDRQEHDRRYAIDAAKSRTKLGWRPQRSLGQGLEATGRLMLANLEWCHQLRQRTGYRGGLRGQLR